MLTKYGYFTIGFVALFSFLLIFIGILIQNNSYKALFILIPLIILVFTISFFRDPERISPNKDNVIVSPADGKVLFLKEVDDNKFINSKAKQISIFMSPLNVHVNRIPVSGKVEYLKYIKGDYIAAFEDKASERNERAEFGIMSKYGKVFFTQVAGFIARRIIYDIKPGDSVEIGKRFGMIKFGSRVDVIVPEGWKPLVNKGNNVKAGESILFEYVGKE